MVFPIAERNEWTCDLNILHYYITYHCKLTVFWIYLKLIHYIFFSSLIGFVRRLQSCVIFQVETCGLCEFRKKKKDLQIDTQPSECLSEIVFICHGLLRDWSLRVFFFFFLLETFKSTQIFAFGSVPRRCKTKESVSVLAAHCS